MPTDTERQTLEEQFAATAREVLTFDQRFKESCYWVDKRRGGMDIAHLDWDDIRQMTIIRIHEQFPTFDPLKGEYRRWVNRVISNARHNIWRDHVSIVSRPCITGKGGCPFNGGGNLCSKTKSGLQCSECPMYADWEKRKGAHHAIRLPKSLEDPEVGNQVFNVQKDFPDLLAMKKDLDARLKKRLTPTEWKIYRLIYIKGLPEEEAARQMGYKAKRGKKKRMYEGYSVVLQAKHRAEEVAREILDVQGMAA